MTCDATTILRLLSEQGRLSAYHLARIIGCDPARVLAVMRDLWWEITAEAGPEGWLYGLRPTLAQRLSKPIEPARQYHNTRGTVMPGAYTP
jgi:hypothetical protein